VALRRAPRPGASRQKAHGGGSFHSERQRGFMWANYPRAAKKWAHNRASVKRDWVQSPRGRGGGAHTHSKKFR
jgi:hypothetical protein